MSAAEVRSRLEEIGLNEHKELVRRVRVHCRSHDVAEDSVQEAYVELLLHADEIRSVDSIKAWLLKVAVREARKTMEKYYRISRACLENEIAFGADDDLSRIFIADIFVQTLRKYPSYYEEVMRLHYMECCSFQEISRRLGISYAAVRQAHHRCKAALRHELEHYCE